MTDLTRKLLLDITESSESIMVWCASKTFEEYPSDRKLRRAAEREFQIIGEALNRLKRTDPVVVNKIKDVSGVVAFRNRIIHGYDTIDDTAVWTIIQMKLPEFKSSVLDLLREVGEEI